MHRYWTPCLVALASLTIATTGFADPPAHAPAHGVRAKHKGHAPAETHKSGGVEIIFDSERGISIALGLPGVYFQAGQFYRHHDGKWQVSLRADGGWKTAQEHATPDVIRRAHSQGRHAKAKAKAKKRGR